MMLRCNDFPVAKISVVNAASGPYMAACTSGMAITNPSSTPTMLPEAMSSTEKPGEAGAGFLSAV